MKKLDKNQILFLNAGLINVSAHAKINGKTIFNGETTIFIQKFKNKLVALSLSALNDFAEFSDRHIQTDGTMVNDSSSEKLYELEIFV